MRAVGSSEGYIYLTYTPEEDNQAFGQPVATFIPEDIYQQVKTFVEVTGVKAGPDYWEKDQHSRLTALLTNMLGFHKDHVSNSLSALGL